MARVQEVKFASTILSTATWSRNLPRRSFNEIKDGILSIDVCSLFGDWIKFGIADEEYNRTTFIEIIKSLEEKLDFEHNFIKIIWVFKVAYEYETEPTPLRQEDHITEFLEDEGKIYQILKIIHSPSFDDCNNLDEICIKHASLELHDFGRAFIAFDTTDKRFYSYKEYMEAKEYIGPDATTEKWLARCRRAIRNYLTYSALKKNIHDPSEHPPKLDSTYVPRYIIHQSAYYWLKNYFESRGTFPNPKHLLLPCSQTIDDDRFIESISILFTEMHIKTTVLSADTDAFVHCPTSYHLRLNKKTNAYDHLVYGPDVWRVALKGFDTSKFTPADYSAILALSKKCDQTGSSIKAFNLPSLDDIFTSRKRFDVINDPKLAFIQLADELHISFNPKMHPADLLSRYLEKIGGQSLTYALGASLMRTRFDIRACMDEAEHGINDIRLKQSIVTYNEYNSE